jgi:hypothetical protein
MTSWAAFAAAQPDMAVLGERILTKYGVAYLATVRSDGAPRVHPVCPALIGDRLYIGVIPSSPKRRDLDRDGRYLLHGLPGPNDAEFSIAGRVHALDRDEVTRLAESVRPNVRLSVASAMYELCIERATATTYVRGPDSTPVPTHHCWPTAVSADDC